jgi:hypothetical protein
MDIFKKAKKLGIDPAFSDGIDYDTFHRKVVEAQNSSRANKAYWIAVSSFLVSLTSLAFNIYINHP